MKRSPPRVMAWAKTGFTPRFEYGDQARAAYLCGTEDGSKLGAGFGRPTKASFPQTVQYDEIILAMEGQATVTSQGQQRRIDRHLRRANCPRRI